MPTRLSADPQPLLTTTETAALLGRPARAIRRLVDEGRLTNAYPDLPPVNRPRRHITAHSVHVYQRAERLATTSPLRRHCALKTLTVDTKVVDLYHRQHRALRLNLCVLELEVNLEVTCAIHVIEEEPKRWLLTPRLTTLPDSAQLVADAGELLRNRRVLAYAYNDVHALALQAAFLAGGFRPQIWPAVGPSYTSPMTAADRERSEAARRLLRSLIGVTCDVLIVKQPEPHFEGAEFDALVLAAPQVNAHHYVLQFLALIHTPTEHPAPVVQVVFTGEQRRMSSLVGEQQIQSDA